MSEANSGGQRIPSLTVAVVRSRSPHEPGPTTWHFPWLAGRSGTIVLEGGDFEPATILAAYRAGFFPWPHEWQELLWFSPDPRAILTPEGFHVSRRLARRLRQGRFRVTIDAAFDEVIEGCADRPEGTWITPRLATAYRRLHRLGWAHSIEVWSGEGHLVGGLYGLAIGGLFGAESMFHRATDASKVALAALVQWCRERGIGLIDVQVLTPHLASLGAVAIPRDEYLRRLREALRGEARFVPCPSAGEGIPRTAGGGPTRNDATTGKETHG